MLAALSLIATLSTADAAGAEVAPPEVLVVADPYARWRDTRWRIDTQVGLPFPVPLYAERNHEVQVVAVDLSLVLACTLDDEVRRRSREVLCTIEDAAIEAAPWRRNPRWGEAVLAETDARLTGLTIRMQVRADGEIGSITLAGEPETNRRVNILYENLRQLVSRALVGFHLELPDQLTVGRVFHERNSRLFSLPSFRFDAAIDSGLPVADDDLDGAVYLDEVPPGAALGPVRPPVGLDGAVLQTPTNPNAVRTPVTALKPGNPFERLQAPASMGFSTIAHRLDLHRGRYLLQSTGEGTLDLGFEKPLTFQGELSAISVFDPHTAVMTERVWTLWMRPTASSVLADGVAGWPYWHHGRLQKLETDERPDLGPTRLVAWPGIQDARGQLDPWPLLP